MAFPLTSLFGAAGSIGKGLAGGSSGPAVSESGDIASNSQISAPFVVSEGDVEDSASSSARSRIPNFLQNPVGPLVQRRADANDTAELPISSANLTTPMIAGGLLLVGIVLISVLKK